MVGGRCGAPDSSSCCSSRRCLLAVAPGERRSLLLGDRARTGRDTSKTSPSATRRVNGPDLVTAYTEGGVTVQLNDGHGHFGAPKTFATGCDTNQVEIADVGAPPSSIFTDGHPDAVISCSYGGGETIELGRMFGDGAGGLSEPAMFPESDYGSFNGLALSHQGFALAEFRGTSGPPIPVWTRLVQPSSFHFARLFCLSYDWSTAQCKTVGEGPEPYVPVVAGRVAEAEAFTNGGPEGLLAWGPTSGVWTRGPPRLRPRTHRAPNPPTSGARSRSATCRATGPTSSPRREPAAASPKNRRAAGSASSTATPPKECSRRKRPPSPRRSASRGSPPATSTSTATPTWSGPTGTTAPRPAGSAASSSRPATALATSARRRNCRSTAANDSTTTRSAVADLDGNGTPDVVAIVGGKVQVLLNQKCRLPPTRPGRDEEPRRPADLEGPGTRSPGSRALGSKATALPTGYVVLGTASNPPTKSVLITLTIPAGKPKGSSLVTARAKGGKKKPKPTVIGKATITVPAGKTVPLKVKLSGAARAKLKKGPLHATATLVATSVSGTKQTKSEALTIKPAKKKRAKK